METLGHPHHFIKRGGSST